MNKLVVALIVLVTALCAAFIEPPACAKRMAAQNVVGICVGE